MRKQSREHEELAPSDASGPSGPSESKYKPRKQFNYQEIKDQYFQNRSKWREVGKWTFAICTLGLGGFYLWATTRVIKEGEIGSRKDLRGNIILLPPGRHSNFPWESYETDEQSLSEPYLKMGPYQIITVETGEVAITNNAGPIEILTEGKYFLEDPNHTFKKFTSVKQETHCLKQLHISTVDRIALILDVDVQFQIDKPEIAVMVTDVNKFIDEKAKLFVANIVGSQSMEQFGFNANVTASTDANESVGRSKLTDTISQLLFKEVAGFGIKILGVGIPNWDFKNKDVESKLAQGAINRATTEAQRAALEQQNEIAMKQAQNSAEIQTTSAKAAADAAKIQAQGEADAAKIRAEGQAAAQAILAKAEADSRRINGQSFFDVGQQLQNCPAGQQILTLDQQGKIVSHANNVHLLFNQQGTGPVTFTQSSPIALPALTNN